MTRDATPGMRWSTEELDARCAPARAVADAVLREGEVLYPYRPSAAKNRMRWQFGVLGPPALATRPGHDRATCATEVVFGGGAVAARVRFLRATPTPEGWSGTATVVVDVDESAPSAEMDGAQVVLRRAGPFVRVEVRNTSTVTDAVDRDAALAHSLLATHVFVAGDGTFASAVDPSPEVTALTDACRQDGLWPVLVGSGLVLAAPIILYDHPEVAPETSGDWGDALEIEELLALRVLTLTDDERAEARAAGGLAHDVLDRAAGPAAAELSAPLHGRLHGRLDGPGDRDSLPAVGATVRLRPRPGADAHDLFFTGRTATVVGHEVDAEGIAYVRVLPDDDPGRDVHEWFGRSWFFRADEIDAVDGATGRSDPCPGS